MTRRLAIMFGGIALALAPAAVAQVQGAAVGERFDGYMGYSADASPAVKRQVGAMNIRRRSLYTGLATRRQVTVQEVGIAAGCERLAVVKVGDAYMLSDGVWRRRAPGQPAPVPAYCGR